MTTLPPPDAPAVFWIDQNGQQQGPESLTTVIERIAYNQIPATTPVWWQGAANWTTFNTVPEFAAALQARLAPAPAAPVEAAPTAESAFTDPAPFAVEPESGSPSLGEVGAAASPLTATELIAQAGAVHESTVHEGAGDTGAAGSRFGTPAEEATLAEELETTRLFDATTEHAALTVESAAEPTVEAEPMLEVAAPESYLGDTAGTIDVGDDVVDAIVVDPSLTAEPAVEPSAEPTTIEPIASPTFDSPSLEPVSLEPITLGGGAAFSGGASGEASGDASGAPGADAATDDLDAVYAELVARAQPYVDEQTRVAALNDTLASLLTRALGSLGHSVNSHQESNGYHVFALHDAQGTPFSLAATQVPYAASVAEAIERPVGIHVDRGGRASAYLYLADYLDRGEAGEGLFGRHVAAVIHAASR